MHWLEETDPFILIHYTLAILTSIFFKNEALFILYHILSLPTVAVLDPPQH